MNVRATIKDEIDTKKGLYEELKGVFDNFIKHHKEMLL
jgi:hypothetical protein